MQKLIRIRQSGESSDCILSFKISRGDLAEICLAAGATVQSADQDISTEEEPAATEIPVTFAGFRASEDKAYKIAQSLVRLSQKRMRNFGLHFLDDPSWHILLDLFIHDFEDKNVSVSSACLAGLAPPTTSLRHISKMVKTGELERVPDPDDHRRVYVRLSSRTRALMIDTLNALG